MDVKHFTASVMEKALKYAVASGCPIIFIRTQDQMDCARRVAEVIVRTNDDEVKRQVMFHDCTRGFTRAQDMPRPVKLQADDVAYTDPQAALDAARSFPKETVTILLGADRWMAEPRPAIAAMLLRDKYKEVGSHLVCLGSAFSVAAELGADVVVVDDPPPSEEERGKVVDGIAEDSGVKIDKKQRAAMLTYTRGLSGFAAEQTCALAIKKDGYDLAVAEKTWREQIDATPGLRVLTDRPSPESVAGLAGWTQHVKRLVGGREPPEAVVFVDEIEKSMAGSGTDTSGSSQQVLGRMLSEMEGTGARGPIFLGPPGTGKTLAATAAGMALGVPTIAFNPSDCKGSLVGETERNTVRALSVLRALAGRAYWIATCNGITNLPPELLRRFTDGVWFFDLPDSEELGAIWAVHLKKYSYKPADRWADDKDWTGADVRNVCREAWNARVPVAEVARGHVPCSRAAAEAVERLRRAADGAFRSAQRPGAYQYREAASRDAVAEAGPRRRMVAK